MQRRSRAFNRRTYLDNLWERNLQAESQEQKASTNLGFDDLWLTGREIPLDASGRPITGGNIGRAYESDWVAHSCIKRLATDMSGVPMRFLSDPDDPESELPDSHPIVKLFRNPNEFFSQREFMAWLMTIMQMRGEWFVTFNDPMRPTEMIQYTDPQAWKEVVSNGRLIGWEFQQGAHSATLSNDSIMHHKFTKPTNPWRGLPPLQAASAAHTLNVGTDELQIDILNRGGERAALYTAKDLKNRTQRDMALEQLRGRKRGPNKVGGDILLPEGVNVIDPKFIEDDMSILESQKMQPDKIASVYGLSLSLLGIEDIDKFATFSGRVKQYFHQTLIPQMRGFEDVFDSYFVQKMPSGWQAYVRFAFDKVPALQDDLEQKFAMAGTAHANGIPWSVLNERFNLGLEIDNIPGADEIMVSSTLAPLGALIDEWSMPVRTVAPAQEPAKVDAVKADQPLTQQDIIDKATDPRRLLQRTKRLRKIEKEYRTGYKALVHDASRKTEAAVLAAGDNLREIEKAVNGQRDKFKPKSGDMAEKHHGAAATEGQASIVALVDKVGDQEMDILRKAGKFRPGVSKWIKGRQRMIEDMSDELFADVLESVNEVVTVPDHEVADVTRVLRDRFRSAPGGANRAITIARTEVGSAYSVARFTEMDSQGFEKHMWLTASDELVRDGVESEFDHTKCNEETQKIGDEFSCGLSYPLESGGEAGNVINCRCETIPVVEGVTD